MRPKLLLPVVPLLLAPWSAPTKSPPRISPGETAAAVRSDFNGDGYADLAVTSPHEVIEGIGDAGGVNVLYGSAVGLTATGDQFWSQDSAGIREKADQSDRFGESLATGDFNGDGYADLAVGTPHERWRDWEDAGVVQIIYGSAAGLTATGNQLWTQEDPQVPDEPELGDLFGWSLAAGDFDGDGFEDLAIAALLETVEGGREGGAAIVMYGSPLGLTGDGSQFWSQDTPGILDQAEGADDFGYSMAAGDFNGDGFADLVAGVVNEAIGATAYVGAANVIYGSAGGLSASGNQIWSQDSPGISGEPEYLDFFGWSVAAGDFGGEGYADLAIGVPQDGVFDKGGVNVVYGSQFGLTATGNQFWSQDPPGVLDEAEGGDLFGYALAAGDFSGDGQADLAIGVEQESLGYNRYYAGVANVLYGGSQGLQAEGNQVWAQDIPGVAGKAEFGENFGFALAWGDFDGTGFQDLAVGVHRDNVGGVESAGGVNVLYGAPSGLSAAGNQLWNQDSPGILGESDFGDELGDTLA